MKPFKPASELLADGWLGRKAAARELGITEQQLEVRARRGDVKRKAIVPGIYVYNVNAGR